MAHVASRHACHFGKPFRQILPLDGANPENAPRLYLSRSTLRLMRAFRVLRLFGRLSSLRQIINALTAAIVNPKPQTLNPKPSTINPNLHDWAEHHHLKP
jgi:hypothetical protein